MRLPSSIASRIRREVRVEHLGPCWIWQGALDESGYGMVKLGGRVLRVHRAVYELARGAIPAGLVLMHACDVRACCNPEHLTPGTVAENADDRSRKGRSPRQPRRAPGCPAGRRYW